MSGFPSPVLATAGSPDPAAPLVVLLHGRGIGRPVAESLRATMNWFREWLDGVAPVGRPVVLVGFSGGAAFGGGLLLDDPDRYAGAAILHGTLPFEAGVPTTPARLAGVPVVVAQGEHDTVIPRELLDRTWDYLLGESGAPTIARRDPVGHGIDRRRSRRWRAGCPSASRSSRAEAGPHPPPRPGRTCPAASCRHAPARGRPSARRSRRAAQRQRALGSSEEGVRARCGAPRRRDAAVGDLSPRGPRVHARRTAARPVDAFLVPSAGEFAHAHPDHDGSLHLALPMRLATDVIAKGWGVAHPLAGVRLTPGTVMLFDPRDSAELETVVAAVAGSHAWASGQLTGQGT